MLHILEKLRSFLFWTTDYFRGRTIKSHVEDIQSILNDSTSKSSLENLDIREKNLIKHAVTTTEFYKGFSDDSDITEFPVISKSVVRDRFEDFISSPYKDEKMITVFTSGSTGAPFKLLQNKGKKARNTADTIYFSSLNGYKVGWRLYFLRLWRDYRKNRCLAWMQNVVLIDVSKLTKKAIQSLIRKLSNDRSKIGIIGYSSALESICHYLDSIKSEKVQADVKTIISIGEGLNDYTRNALDKYFDAPVVSRYSNVENGILAQQDINRINTSDFLINLASYGLEILDIEKDILLKDGELGRIVITDYYNYGMPLIRYDTGDLGVTRTIKVGGVNYRVLSKIEGRLVDMIFDTKGNLLSTFIFWSLMKKKTEIKEFQFIQKEEKKYKLVLKCKSPYTGERKLVEGFLERLGEDAELTLEYVDEIPLLSSGKRKIMVNEYRNT